ncbi:hypothetical protein B0A55_13096 [Friedmanniomyces simplex]|uniref:Uncharacterized protein n=1 Tax=Friedmanniomyces simplex TaxID=329884 RepID=A0A4U0WN93_9PEZI|nr:hypothetical protein B0A55_13096 [Friedmanniomyces simplex]
MAESETKVPELGGPTAEENINDIESRVKGGVGALMPKKLQPRPRDEQGFRLTSKPLRQDRYLPPLEWDTKLLSALLRLAKDATSTPRERKKHIRCAAQVRTQIVDAKNRGAFECLASDVWNAIRICAAIYKAKLRENDEGEYDALDRSQVEIPIILRSGEFVKKNKGSHLEDLFEAVNIRNAAPPANIEMHAAAQENDDDDAGVPLEDEPPADPEFQIPLGDSDEEEETEEGQEEDQEEGQEEGQEEQGQKEQGQQEPGPEEEAEEDTRAIDDPTSVTPPEHGDASYAGVGATLGRRDQPPVDPAPTQEFVFRFREYDYDEWRLVASLRRCHLTEAPVTKPWVLKKTTPDVVVVGGHLVKMWPGKHFAGPGDILGGMVMKREATAYLDPETYGLYPILGHRVVLYNHIMRPAERVGERAYEVKAVVGEKRKRGDFHHGKPPHGIDILMRRGWWVERL